MAAALLFAAAISTDGPDLGAIDRAVAKCDAKVMSTTFSAEPQRRRAFAIEAFNEQQDIVAARRALAAKRLTPSLVPSPVTGGLMPADSRAEIDRESQLLAERQQALDDARMLGAMRDQALDLMRQQYVSRCSTGKSDEPR